MTPAKSWPLCLTISELVLHGVLTPPAPERLTTLDLWPSLRPISKASLLLIFFFFLGYSFAVPVWAAESKQITVALGANLGHVISFPYYFQANNAPFVAKATHNGLIVKVFNGSSMCPTIHMHLVLWGLTSFLKNWLKKISIFPTSSLSIYLSKAVWSLNTVVSKKGSSLLSYFLGNAQEKSGGVYRDLFWKFRFPSCPILSMMLLSFPNGNPKPAWLVLSLDGSSVQNKSWGIET